MHFRFVRLVPYHIISGLLLTWGYLHIYTYMHTLSINPLCFPLLFQVAVWFERPFPSVSYPSSRLGGVLGSILKKTKNLFAEHAKLKCILQNHVDFVSIAYEVWTQEGTSIRRGD